MTKIGTIQKRLSIVLMIISWFGFLGSIYFMLFSSPFSDQSVITYFSVIIGVLSICVFVTCYLIHQGSVFFLQVLQSVLIMLTVVAFAVALIIPAAWMGYIIGTGAGISLYLTYIKD